MVSPTKITSILYIVYQNVGDDTKPLVKYVKIINDFGRGIDNNNTYKTIEVLFFFFDNKGTLVPSVPLSRTGNHRIVGIRVKTCLGYILVRCRKSHYKPTQIICSGQTFYTINNIITIEILYLLFFIFFLLNNNSNNIERVDIFL